MCQFSSDNGHATDWHLVHIGVRISSRTHSPHNLTELIGLCDARGRGRHHGSDRGRSRRPHRARGRGSVDRLASRAAQAHSRLCAHADIQDRRATCACWPQGFGARAVAPDERRSHTPRGHLDCVCRREGVAGQWYLLVFCAGRDIDKLFVLLFSLWAWECAVVEGIRNSQGNVRKRSSACPRRICGSDE